MKNVFNDYRFIGLRYFCSRVRRDR